MESKGSGGYERRQQHGRSWGAGRAPGCGRKRLLGHTDPGQGLCAGHKNQGFHSVGGEFRWAVRAPAQWVPPARWAGCGAWRGLMRHRSLLGLFPCHRHGACSRNDHARAVSQGGNEPQLSYRRPLLASSCHVPLPQRAQPGRLAGTQAPPAPPSTPPRTTCPPPFHPPTAPPAHTSAPAPRNQP